MKTMYFNAIETIDFDSLTMFTGSGIMLMSIVLMATVLMMMIADIRNNTKDYMLVADEPEILALGSAEDCTLQDYLNGKVNLLARTKTGKFVKRRIVTVQAAITPIMEIHDEAQYSKAAAQTVDLQEWAEPEKIRVISTWALKLGEYDRVIEQQEQLAKSLVRQLVMAKSKVVQMKLEMEGGDVPGFMSFGA